LKTINLPFSDDTLDFLAWLSGLQDRVFILSNNDGAQKIAGMLGIAPYIEGYFTPGLCGVRQGKPHRALWDYVVSRHNIGSAVMVGDDPWSDGAFADVCGVPCFIVDRLDRFGDLERYRRVTSLRDVRLLDRRSGGPGA
jgi:FMN phosphatase YigB (HAD superfamily)